MTLVLRPFSRRTRVRQYQNVSILDFIGAKDDGGGGDNWSYKMGEAPVRIVTHHQQINIQLLQA